MRYTVLRLLVFCGVFLAAWLVGLRGIVLLAVAALVSSIISVFLLAGPREELADKIDAKVQQRRSKAEENRTFEDDEDE